MAKAGLNSRARFGPHPARATDRHAHAGHPRRSRDGGGPLSAAALRAARKLALARARHAGARGP